MTSVSSQRAPNAARTASITGICHHGVRGSAEELAVDAFKQLSGALPCHYSWKLTLEGPEGQKRLHWSGLRDGQMVRTFNNELCTYASPSRCHQPGMRSATPSGYRPLKMALRENGVAVGRMEQ